MPKSLGEMERRPVPLTSQLDRDVQLDYCAGARRDGIRCHVVRATAKKTQEKPRALTFYITQARDQASLARKPRLTAPFRRSKKIRARILKHKAWLALPRKYTRESITRARKEVALL